MSRKKLQDKANIKVLEKAKKAGLKVPDTWEDLYTVGKELKKMGHPVGIPVSQNYDTISTGSVLLWCYGARERERFERELFARDGDR